MDDKQLFAVIRGLVGRGLTQAEVDQINRALYTDIVAAPERRLGAEGLQLIKSFEGYKAKTYRDPGSGDKPYTGGWGTTTDEHGNPLPLGVTWPESRWEALLRHDIAAFEVGVNTLLGTAPTSQNQFDALVSFAYNVGLDIDQDHTAEGLGDSTLLRLHLAGDYTGAQAQFVHWNKAAGHVMAGLTRRRQAEAELYGRG